MSSPALCTYDTSKSFTFENCKFLAIPQTKKLAGIYQNIEIIENLGSVAGDRKRFDHLSAASIKFIVENNVDICCMENYAYGARGRVFTIGENSGLLKHKIWQTGRVLNMITPSEIKKCATGKGNANKEAMVAQFTEDTNIDLKEYLSMTTKKVIPSPVDDIVDSYYIVKTWLFGLDK
ncbi:MAG: hypothetical protein R8M45_03595 [Ghiorsea sp.]